MRQGTETTKKSSRSFELYINKQAKVSRTQLLTLETEGRVGAQI
jgi:hypothetical protein